MVVSLVWVLMDNSTLFKEILVNFCSFNGSTLVEKDVDVLSETRGIVISHSLCISEGFENRIRF